MFSLQAFSGILSKYDAGISGRQAEPADRRGVYGQADETAFLFDCDCAIRHGDRHAQGRFASPCLFEIG